MFTIIITLANTIVFIFLSTIIDRIRLFLITSIIKIGIIEVILLYFLFFILYSLRFIIHTRVLKLSISLIVNHRQFEFEFKRDFKHSSRFKLRFEPRTLNQTVDQTSYGNHSNRLNRLNLNSIMIDPWYWLFQADQTAELAVWRHWTVIQT